MRSGQAASCSRRPSSHAGTNGGNAFQLISCQIISSQKKSGVENPEWDISICAIVGLPLKKISFCHSLPFQMRILIILGYTVHYYTHGIPHFRTNLFAKLLHN